MSRAGAAATGLACLLAAGPASAQAGELALLSRLEQVAPAIGACWRAPEGLSGFETVAVTVRFALRVDGSLIGPPRVTFVGLPLETGRLRDVLTRSAVAAVEACTPVPISASLGRAIAGRVFSVRFIYRGPQGRGA